MNVVLGNTHDRAIQSLRYQDVLFAVSVSHNLDVQLQFAFFCSLEAHLDADVPFK